MGDSPKRVKSRRRRKKKKERAEVGNNNGQATHGARKVPGPKKIALLIYKPKRRRREKERESESW